MRVLLVCEKSAGHIFPALVWAKKLKEENEVYFFATSSFLKAFLQSENFAVYGRGFSRRNLILEGFYRFWEALWLIFRLHPKRLVGFGGRDSFFLILFGSLLGLDTAIYEPNAKLGYANRVLALFVRTVFLGFAKPMEGKKVKVIGVPLRENLKKIDKEEARRTLGFNEKPVVMCFGGSLGSEFLNRTFLKLVQNLEGDFQIIHLAGRRDYFKILQFYNKIERRKFIKDFYYPMQILYSSANLIISRSGASTLAEIAHFRVPAILFTLPKAGGHQIENAQYFKDQQAAIVFSDNDFNFEEFKSAVKKILFSPDLQNKMKENLSNVKWGVSFEDFKI